MHRLWLTLLVGVIFCCSCGGAAETETLSNDCAFAATYFGGSGSERIVDAVVGQDGNIYVVGTTDSPDLPVSYGAYTAELNGGDDVFVAVLDHNLEHVLACTFLGGRTVDAAGAIALDASGHVLVSGHTDSQDFPVTSDAFDPEHNGGTDLFVTKLSSDLTTVLASTFVGGGAEDQSGELAVSEDGESVYVVGRTRSSDCPTLDASFSRERQGDWEAYLARLSSDLDVLQGATYFGGAGEDLSAAVHGAPDGDVYVAVVTDAQGYPGFGDAYSDELVGYYDIAVVRFDAGLSMLRRATFFGGRNMDDCKFLALDRNGNVIIGGHSNAPGCPTTPDAFDTTHNGSDEGFVSVLSGDLTSLLAATYLGGPSTTESLPAYAATIDANDRVVVVGPVYQWRQPTPGAFSEAISGGHDVLVSVFDPRLQTLLYGTFVGGRRTEIATTVVAGGEGEVYILGQTGSDDFPVSAGAFDQSLSGSDDAFAFSFQPPLVR